MNYPIGNSKCKDTGGLKKVQWKVTVIQYLPYKPKIIELFIYNSIEHPYKFYCKKGNYFWNVIAISKKNILLDKTETLMLNLRHQ